MLSIENVDTIVPLLNARLFVQGHTDSEDNILLNGATNVKNVSVRRLIAITEVFGYRVWHQDVGQAHLQSANSLMRKVYVRPSK